ncbi:MAG: hypothetical protein ABI548_12730 [Polyangiaceae bacterium]
MKRLLTESVSDAVLDDVARDLMEPVRALSRAILELLASNRDEFRASVMDDLLREEGRLNAFLPDDDSRDTLAWVLGFLRSFVGLVMTMVEPEHLASLDAEQLTQESTDPDLASFMRGQVALMAAVEAVRQGAGGDRCSTLIDSAFLSFMAFRSAIRNHGLWLSPFPNETSAERQQSLLRYAARLRETLTDQDWQTLERACARRSRTKTGKRSSAPAWVISADASGHERCLGVPQTGR